MGNTCDCADPTPEREPPPELSPDERQYYRDKLRSARYAALANSEGFLSICFVLEDLGIRLLGIQKSIGGYQQAITHLVPKKNRKVEVGQQHLFSPFSVLYQTVRNGRNDAMHTGSYARHVTVRAIELCVLLEDSLMSSADFFDKPVLNYMVREPTVLDELQPVARARQLMLTHSFSNIPVFTGGSWHLLSDISLSKYLANNSISRELLLGYSIKEAFNLPEGRLKLQEIAARDRNTKVGDLLNQSADNASLWVIAEGPNILGIITPFELM